MMYLGRKKNQLLVTHDNMAKKATKRVVEAVKKTVVKAVKKEVAFIDLTKKQRMEARKGYAK